MKNPLASLFRFVLQSVGFSRRAKVEERIPPEQLRDALTVMFRDPPTRQFLLRELMGAAPIAGGSPDTYAEDVSAGNFGQNTGGGNYAFPGNLAISGYVGIGTTGPPYKLTVSASGAGGDVAAYQNTNASGYSDALFLDNSGAWKLGIGYGNASSSGQFAGKNFIQSAVVDLEILGGAFGTAPLVRITNSGNVGIGTTAPTEKLEVAGKIKASGAKPVVIDPGEGAITAASLNGIVFLSPSTQPNHDDAVDINDAINNKLPPAAASLC